MESLMKSEPPKKRKVQAEFSEESLEQAVREVREEENSIRGAAKKYGVPKYFITRRLRGNVPEVRRGKRGYMTVFSPEEEQMIISHVVALAAKGFKITHFGIRILIHVYLTRIERIVPKFIDNMPGSEWAVGFSKRHKQKLSECASSCTEKPHRALDLSSINEYFDELGYDKPCPASDLCIDVPDNFPEYENPGNYAENEDDPVNYSEDENMDQSYECEAVYNEEEYNGAEVFVIPSTSWSNNEYGEQFPWWETDCIQNKSNETIKEEYSNQEGNLKNQEFSEELLEQVLEEVREEIISIRAASKKYGIPKYYISRKLRGNVPETRTKKGFKTVFSPEEEEAIVSHVINLSSKGFKITRFGLQVFIHGYLTRIGRKVAKFADNMPGNEWARLFLKRNKEKLSGYISAKNERLKALDLTAINQYFVDLGFEPVAAVDANQSSCEGF